MSLMGIMYLSAGKKLKFLLTKLTCNVRNQANCNNTMLCGKANRFIAFRLIHLFTTDHAGNGAVTNIARHLRNKMAHNEKRL